VSELGNGRFRRQAIEEVFASEDPALPNIITELARTNRRTRSERRFIHERENNERIRNSFLQRNEERRVLARDEISHVTDVFRQWQTTRIINQNINTNNSISATLGSVHAIAAREIYNQTALRLERTRELLSARQAQHLLLSARLEASTRAISAHIDSIRGVLDLNQASHVDDPASNVILNQSAVLDELHEDDQDNLTIL
jgi:hypothetical protein